MSDLSYVEKGAETRASSLADLGGSFLGNLSLVGQEKLEKAILPKQNESEAIAGLNCKSDYQYRFH